MKKSHWILTLFLSEAAEASRYYFFENRWKKLKCPNLLKPLGTLIFKNIGPSIPQSHLLVAISLWHTLYNMELIVILRINVHKIQGK